MYDYTDLIDRMKDTGVTFTDGLNEHEIAEIEEKYGFRFPRSLREF